MWNRLKDYLRSTFITGVFSAIPLVATIFVLWYVDKVTREPVKQLLGLDAPFVGFAVALVGIFVLGVLVRSIVGKYLLAAIDALLLKVPVLAEVYKAWKQVSLTPGGSEGMYAKVVLVQLDGEAWHLAFTSGEPIEGDPETICVFVPTVPNPIAGRLLFVPKARTRPTALSVEEMFKYLLSSGNYVPPEVGAASRRQ